MGGSRCRDERDIWGAKRVWPFLLCWLPLAAAVVAASLLSGCAAQTPGPSLRGDQTSKPRSGEESEHPRGTLNSGIRLWGTLAPR